MAKNTDISQLDHFVALKRAVEASDDALRVKLIEGLEMSMELDADDGDSVKAVADTVTHSVSLDNSSTGDVLAPQDASKAREVQLYVHSTSAVSGVQNYEIMVSPVASGDVWRQAASIVASGTNGAVVVSPITNIVAQRIKVQCSGSMSSGSVDLHLVIRS